MTPAAQEYPNFPITRQELLILAKHWLKEAMHCELSWFEIAGHQFSDLDDCGADYAIGRVRNIEAVVGMRAVAAVHAELVVEVREERGDDFWEAFRRQDTNFADRLYEEHEKDSDYLALKGQDKQTLDAVFEYLRNNPDEGYRIDDAGDLWTLAPSECNSARLILNVTIPNGRRTWFECHRIDRPAGWRAPFGIRPDRGPE
jgi:hypothetical protein